MFWFLSCFVFQIPFLIFAFLFSKFKLCFFGQHQCCYVSKRTTYKTLFFGQEGGATKQFLNNLYSAHVKNYRFLGPILGQILVDAQKNNVK